MSLRGLVLLRHGQTDYNLAGRMQGHLESQLTDLGQAQAAAVAPEIVRMAPDLLISSDLRRAIDTADVVGAATGLPVKLDPRLRETHLGEWQGRSVEEIERGWQGRSRPGAHRSELGPAGGVADRTWWRRSTPVIDELDDEVPAGSDATAILVAHGGMIAGLVCGLLALPTSCWPAIGGIGNCRWAALGRRADHPRWRLVGYNVGIGT